MIYNIHSIVIRMIIPRFYMTTLRLNILANLLKTMEVQLKEVIVYKLLVLLIAISKLLFLYKIISKLFSY